MRIDRENTAYTSGLIRYLQNFNIREKGDKYAK